MAGNWLNAFRRFPHFPSTSYNNIFIISNKFGNENSLCCKINLYVSSINGNNAKQLKNEQKYNINGTVQAKLKFRFCAALHCECSFPLKIHIHVGSIQFFLIFLRHLLRFMSAFTTVRVHL